MTGRAIDSRVAWCLAVAVIVACIAFAMTFDRAWWAEWVGGFVAGWAYARLVW